MNMAFLFLRLLSLDMCTSWVISQQGWIFRVPDIYFHIVSYCGNKYLINTCAVLSPQGVLGDRPLVHGRAEAALPAVHDGHGQSACGWTGETEDDHCQKRPRHRTVTVPQTAPHTWELASGFWDLGLYLTISRSPGCYCREYSAVGGTF